MPRHSICIALLTWASLAQAADYLVLAQSQPAGQLKVTSEAEGWVAADYSYRDNGRGPDIQERFRLAENGVPIRYDGRGRSTMGAVIGESFERTGDQALWRSRADAGQATVGDDYLHIPLEASPAYYGAVVQALLRQPARSGSALKGIKVQAEVLTGQTVTGPDGPVKLSLVALTGADTQPWYYWVRDDAHHALLAITWPGFAVIERGFEAHEAALLAAQTQAADARLMRLRQRLARPFDGVTLIRNVRWFDAPAARMRGPSDVWLSHGRIDAITTPGGIRVLPDRAIDGRDKTLLPGLWDMHAHMSAPDGLAYLAAGITGVRDPGNENAELLRLRGRIERGEVIGPTIQAAGFIEGKSPFSSRTGIVADSLEEALDAVGWYAAHGYVGVKLYNSMRPEWVKPVAARARQLGLHVSGHVPAFMRAEEVVKAGYDELTHMNQVMLNFVSQPGDDSRTLLRFNRVGAEAHKLDLKGTRVQAFLRLLRERGTVVDPTLVTFEDMFTQAQGQMSAAVADVVDHLPVLWQRQARSASMDLDAQKLRNYRSSFTRMLEMAGGMHRKGVTLVAGTDGWAGLGLHRELALYVRAGIPAPEVLRIATWNGARVAGAGATRGQIARGYAADLVLVDGDPAVDIASLRRASLVIQGQVAYAPSELYEAIGHKPFVTPPRLVLRPASEPALSEQVGQ